MIMLFIATVLANPCPTGRAKAIETITHPALTEVSGMIVANNRLWVHNDSGNPPQLITLLQKGTEIQPTLVAKAHARDWEDIAWFNHNGLDYLLIADTGDNLERYSSTAFYVVALPHSAEPMKLPEKIALSYKFTVDYGMIGPKDAEAVFVDPVDQSLIVLTKGREGTAYWLTAPLPESPAHVHMTMFHSEKLRDTPPKTFVEGAVMKTAADISRDGRWIVTRSYLSAQLYYRPEGVSLAEALQGKPCELPLPLERQGESIAFSEDGQSLWSLSEGKKTILHNITLSFPESPDNQQAHTAPSIDETAKEGTEEPVKK